MNNFLKILKGIITNNFLLKIVSIFFASLVFYLIRDITSEEGTFDVPIDVVVEPGVAILAKKPPYASVTIRGSREDIKKINASSLKVLVKVEGNFLAGEREVKIGPRNIHGYYKPWIVSVKPESVILSLDREIQKKVDVERPVLLGMPQLGTMEMDYQPKSVTISGPKRILEKIDSVFVEPVDIGGRMHSFTVKRKILPPVEGGVFSVNPSEVTVFVNILPRPVSMAISNVPVRAAVPVDLPVMVKIFPTSVTVRLYGTMSEISTTSVTSIFACVDCSKIKYDKETYELPLFVSSISTKYIYVTIEPSNAIVSVNIITNYSKIDLEENE